MPERCAIDMIIIMPASVPMVFQSMPLSASAWSSAPMTIIADAPSQRDYRPVVPSQMMTA